MFHHPSSCRLAGFRSLQTDAAKCKQLHLQSLFSFRRFAPADDYLGSPFSLPSTLSAFLSVRFLRFRPFFWAFRSRCRSLPLSSTSLGFAVRSPCSASGYSASCSSFQPSIGSASQWLSQRPDVSFRPRQIFPVPDDWFPVRLSRFCLFSFPVCSFSLFPASLPQPFHRCSSFLPVLPFHLLVRPCVRSLSAFLSVRVSGSLPPFGFRSPSASTLRPFRHSPSASLPSV